MGIIVLLCGAFLTRTVTLGEPLVVSSPEPGYCTVLLENTRRASSTGHPLLPLVPVVMAVTGQVEDVAVDLGSFTSVPLDLPVEPASNLRPIGSGHARPAGASPEGEASASD